MLCYVPEILVAKDWVIVVLSISDTMQCMKIDSAAMVSLGTIQT